MTPFEVQLAKVAGTIHRVYMDDHQHRMQNGLLYYWNKGESLYSATKLLMSNGGPRPVAAMLAGMALEVLLKGIAVALDNPAKNVHRLTELLSMSESTLERTRDNIDDMTEHIYWAGRYTAH